MPTSDVDQKHPDYTEYSEDWELLRHCHKGERTVKEQGFTYLSPTSGMEEDGVRAAVTTAGWKAYDAYRKRAVFPDFVYDAVEAALGVMHLKPATIELPDRLEPIRELATLQNESLQMLLQRINAEQLLVGRLGLHLDVPDGRVGEVLPYIATYDAEHILNWDAGRRDGLERDQLNLVVLDESEPERKGFHWEEVDKYRVLILGELGENEPEGTALYRSAVVRRSRGGGEESALEFVEPALPGGRTLQRIPFVFVNTKDVVPEPDKPPLLGLANLSMAIYRGEADYRQSLFQQGQDTLVIMGATSEGEEDVRVGAGSHLRVPMGGDAKYIGVESAGLSEQREALENDRAAAMQKGGQLLDSTSRERESGDALRVRVAARTATLTQIAQTGAFALQEALRMMAEWVGADPEQVVVEPNLDFTDDQMDGKSLLELMSAKAMGAPLSQRSIHVTMQQRGLTEMEYEDELAAIEEEPPLGTLGVEDEDDGDDDQT